MRPAGARITDVLRVVSASLLVRAQAAGVELRLAVYKEMVHVWHMLRGVAPEAQQAIDEVGAFVREHAG